MPESIGKQALTYLAFDYGTKRIGVAVGQSLTRTAQPLTTLQRSNNTTDWAAITELHHEWQPDGYIIGLPLHQDGSENAVCQAARQFAQQLKQRLQCPVHFFDERYTSTEASAFIKQQQQNGQGKRRQQKEELDKLAAAILLQSWLNSQR